MKDETLNIAVYSRATLLMRIYLIVGVSLERGFTPFCLLIENLVYHKVIKVYSPFVNGKNEN